MIQLRPAAAACHWQHSRPAAARPRLRRRHRPERRRESFRALPGAPPAFGFFWRSRFRRAEEECRRKGLLARVSALLHLPLVGSLAGGKKGNKNAHAAKGKRRRARRGRGQRRRQQSQQEATGGGAGASVPPKARATTDLGSALERHSLSRALALALAAHLVLCGTRKVRMMIKRVNRVARPWCVGQKQGGRSSRKAQQHHNVISGAGGPAATTCREPATYISDSAGLSA